LDNDAPIDMPTPVTAPRRGRHEAPRAPWMRRVRTPRRQNRPFPFVDREATERSARRSSTFRRLLLLADLLAVSLSLFLVTITGAEGFRLAAILVIPMIGLIGKISGLYDRDEFLLAKTTLDEAPSLFRLATLSTLLVFLSGNVLIEGGFGRWQALSFWALLFLGLVGFRYLARRVAAHLTDDERCLIVGNAHSADWLATKLSRSERTRVDVVGRVSLDRNGDRKGDGLTKLGELADLGGLLDTYGIDRAIVAPGQGDPEREVLTAIRILKRHGVYVSVLPSPLEVIGTAVEFDEVEGATLLGVRRHGLTRSSRLVKRTFDLALALPGIIILAPTMAIIAVAIKLDSRGPVFFRQPRMGKDDKPFQIFKFRTMVDGADTQRASLADRNEAHGGLFKIDADPRITRVGGFLRRTSLDEIPQLLNVIKRDMSLVGPRPLVLDEDQRIEGFDRSRLLVVPPGVTGMWQILGSARIPMDEMLKIDYLYGAHWSLWLDVKILVRTVPFALARRGL
jgi:exopolysaccharide biosynthesis polyprenyl glycosylphosphotransferase